MRDSKSIIKLCEENPELDAYIRQLENKIRDYEQFSIRTCPPNKTYKQLEEELALAENSKQAEIDELYETKIEPLQNQVKDREIKMESMYKQQVSYTEEIGYLKNKITDLNMIINYAAGYISSCEQFRDKYPHYVKMWLSKGLKNEI